MSTISIRAALQLRNISTISALIADLDVSGPFSLLTALGVKEVTAIIDTIAHPAARTFYEAFPEEPVSPAGSVQVAEIIPIPRMTVMSLLQAILDQARPDILIVCHGTSHRLMLPLSENTDIELTGPNADLLVKWVNGKQSEAAMRAGIEPAGAWDTWSLAEQTRFATLLEKVRALQLDRVELRACNAGSSEDTLNSLRRFFDCRLLSAPMILDGFGDLNFGRTTQHPADWRDFRRAHRIRFDNDEVAIATENIDFDALTFEFVSLARSAPAIRRFADDHIVGAAGTTLGNRFITHALVSPGTPPIFTADVQYREHLTLVDDLRDPFPDQP